MANLCSCHWHNCEHESHDGRAGGGELDGGGCVTDWQPIDSAPLDGTRVLLECVDSDTGLGWPYVGYWSWVENGDGCWLENYSDEEIIPTHWAPISPLVSAWMSERTSMAPTDPQDWYNKNIVDPTKEGRSKCCNAPIEDAGSCYEGCCDRWQCSQCKRRWLVEVGD